jgi:hypothetical protein
MKDPFHSPTVKVLKIGTAVIPSDSSLRGGTTKQSLTVTDPVKVPVIASDAGAKQSQAQNRKLDQVDREIQRIRYQRAQVHLKYRDLLGPNLLPKSPKSDFLTIYEEIEALSEELRALYVKKRQIELTGDYKAPKTLDNVTQNKIEALKNEKRSVSNIKNKTQKALQKATVMQDVKTVQKYEKKLVELDLKWMDLESQIEKLTHV